MKYFYRDWLAVAWLAAHFRMEFEPIDVLKCSHPGYGNIEKDEKLLGLCRRYIHPDSLYLLEPRVGDIVVDGINPKIIVNDFGEGDFIADCTVEIGQLERSAKIIQRNGIPFMMPEVEE